MLAGLPDKGVEVTHLRLPDGFPYPDRPALDESLHLLQAVGPGDALLIDGLAFGALPAPALAGLRAPIVALVHHPLGYETGLSQAESARLITAERAALAHARAVIVPSAVTRDTLVADFGVPLSRLTIAEPGTEPAARATGSGGPEIALLAVGSLVPRKGFDGLITALAGLRYLPWRLTIIGSAERDPACATALRHTVAALGLADRITLAGELTDAALAQAYGRADLFVFPSHYEGYGMVLAEALARGLPIVTTTGGASATTVPDAAALKVPPADGPALAAALAQVLGDARLRLSLAEASWQAGRLLPRWTDTTGIIASVLKAVAGARP